MKPERVMSVEDFRALAKPKAKRKPKRKRPSTMVSRRKGGTNPHCTACPSCSCGWVAAGRGVTYGEASAHAARLLAEHKEVCR